MFTVVECKRCCATELFLANVAVILRHAHTIITYVCGSFSLDVSDNIIGR